MNTRPFHLLAGAMLALCSTSFGGDGKYETIHAEADARQSEEEVEDLGEIAADDGSDWRSKFRANFSFRSDYTSNAKLSGNHSSSDVLFFPTVEFGFNSGVHHGFSFDLSTKVESGIYAAHDERSFTGYSAVATADWRPRPNLPRIFVSAEPYRFDNFDIGGLMTQAVGLNLGTDWGVPFNNGNSMAFVGYSLGHYFADPGIDTRHVHRTVAGVVHQIRPQLMGQVFYAYQYSDYETVARHDSRHVAGVIFTYQFNQRLFGSLSGSFIDNDSSQARASYQSVLVAAAVNWQF